MKGNPSSVWVVDRRAGDQFCCFGIIFASLMEFLPEPFNDCMNCFDIRNSIIVVIFGKKEVFDAEKRAVFKKRVKVGREANEGNFRNIAGWEFRRVMFVLMLCSSVKNSLMFA